MICQNSPIHFHALLFQNIVSHWCFWRRIYTDIFTCSQLPGLQKPSLLVLKSENVLVAQDPTTTTATRERHQKSKRFNMQNNIFARAPYLFCLFFSRLRRENFMFYEGRKLATTNLPFSF